MNNTNNCQNILIGDKYSNEFIRGNNNFYSDNKNIQKGVNLNNIENTFLSKKKIRRLRIKKAG